MRDKGTPAALTIPEIVDQVFVHSTKRCLKKCSLVCRAWSYLAAKYLFATIHFNPQHQLPVPLVGEYVAFTSIIALLVGKPRVLDSVRHVIVEHKSKIRRKKKLSFSVYQDVPCSLQLLEDIYTTFPRLASLRIKGISGSGFSPSLRSPVQHLVPSMPLRLHKLEIVTSPSTTALVPIEYLIGVFTEIGTLVLHRECHNILQPPRPLPFNRTRIHRLALCGLDDDRMNRICKAVTSLDLSCLTSLFVLDHYPTESVRFVNDFIREHVPHIRNFLVQIEEDIALDYFPRYKEEDTAAQDDLMSLVRLSDNEEANLHAREAFGFALSPCVQLSNVAVAICIMSDCWLVKADRLSAWQNENVWEPAIGIALNATAGTLERVCLCLSYSTPLRSRSTEEQFHALHGLNWALLERVLERHPQLAALEIRLSGTLPCPQKAQQVIDSQLPSMVQPIVQYRFTSKVWSDVFG